MNTHVVPGSIRRAIISSIALGSLASVLLLQAAGPADAKPMSRCQVKHSQCSERCIMNNDGGQINACIQRTCNVQNPGCGGDSLEGRGTTGPRCKGRGCVGLVGLTAPKSKVPPASTPVTQKPNVGPKVFAPRDKR